MNSKLIIFAFLFALINSECEPPFEDLPQLKKLRDYEDCASRTSQQELDEGGFYECCHIYYEIDSNNLYQEVDTCILVTKNQFDNIDDYIDDFERRGGYENIHIHCTGFITQFNLLLSLLILLFLL